MQIEQIDTHSVDVDLLKPEGYALDVGCRGFVFARAMAERGLYVLALDPDPDIKDPEESRVIFEAKALVNDAERTEAVYATWSTGEGNHLCIDRPVPSYAEPKTVPCANLARFLEQYEIDFFEIVKLDCEGGEYDILLNWPGPISRQITVEFHDFAGFNPFPDPEEYHQKLLEHLGRWYNVIQHEKFPHPLAPSHPINYWDSLFVLR